MSFIMECWLSKAGPKWVTTTQNKGESREDFIARHNEAVRILMAECPAI